MCMLFLGRCMLSCCCCQQFFVPTTLLAVQLTTQLQCATSQTIALNRYISIEMCARALNEFEYVHCANSRPRRCSVNIPTAMTQFDAKVELERYAPEALPQDRLQTLESGCRSSASTCMPRRRRSREFEVLWPARKQSAQFDDKTAASDVHAVLLQCSIPASPPRAAS